MNCLEQRVAPSCSDSRQVGVPEPEAVPGGAGGGLLGKLLHTFKEPCSVVSVLLNFVTSVASISLFNFFVVF